MENTGIDRYLKKGASYERLKGDYLKYGSLIIAYDFDDTVHDFHNTGETYEMVRKLLRDCKSVGFTCICWTANANLEYVSNFLSQNGIPCDGINSDGIKLPWASRKPFYSTILDDKCGLRQVYEDLQFLVHGIKTGNIVSQIKH